MWPVARQYDFDVGGGAASATGCVIDSQQQFRVPAAARDLELAHRDGLQRGMGALVDTILGRWFTAEFLRQHPESVQPIRAMFSPRIRPVMRPAVPPFATWIAIRSAPSAPRRL